MCLTPPKFKGECIADAKFRGRGNTYYHSVQIGENAAGVVVRYCTMTKDNPSGKAPVTSRDVARAANVSQALVSRAFTGNGRIAPATKERILRIAQDLGWQPNALARSMVTGDAPLVAIITARLHFEWRAQVLSHLLKSIQQWHLKPLLFYAEKDDEVDRLLEESMGWRTRGVIVMAGDVSSRRAEAIVSGGRFLAALNRPANHPDAFSVATDNRQGGTSAAHLLLEEGRKRFLLIGGGQDSWASRLRTQGFVDGLRGHGNPLLWNNDAMTIEAGRACAADFLSLPEKDRPDGVFAANDAIALGFMDGLRGKVSMPDDLSLLGFDNLPASSWSPYQLTTFEQPLDQMVGRIVHHINLQQKRDAPLSAFPPIEANEDGVTYCAPTIIRRSTTKSKQ